MFQHWVDLSMESKYASMGSSDQCFDSKNVFWNIFVWVALTSLPKGLNYQSILLRLGHALWEKGIGKKRNENEAEEVKSIFIFMVLGVSKNTIQTVKSSK